MTTDSQRARRRFALFALMYMLSVGIIFTAIIYSGVPH